MSARLLATSVVERDLDSQWSKYLGHYGPNARCFDDLGSLTLDGASGTMTVHAADIEYPGDVGRVIEACAQLGVPSLSRRVHASRSKNGGDEKVYLPFFSGEFAGRIYTPRVNVGDTVKLEVGFMSMEGMAGTAFASASCCDGQTILEHQFGFAVMPHGFLRKLGPCQVVGEAADELYAYERATSFDSVGEIDAGRVELCKTLNALDCWGHFGNGLPLLLPKYRALQLVWKALAFAVHLDNRRYIATAPCGDYRGEIRGRMMPGDHLLFRAEVLSYDPLRPMVTGRVRVSKDGHETFMWHGDMTLGEIGAIDVDRFIGLASQS